MINLGDAVGRTSFEKIRMRGIVIYVHANNLTVIIYIRPLFLRNPTLY